MNKETDMTMKLNPYFKDTLETSNVVWSHDENSYQFNFDFTDYLCKNPVELMNSHPRILLEFLNDDCSDKQIYPLIIDSERLGQAHFIIPNKILGYVGDVKASLTIDFDDKTHDLGSFYFRMKKSPIDEKMPELQFWVDEFDQAVELFKHGLDEFNEDIKESNAKVDELKQQIKDNNIVKTNDFNDFKSSIGNANEFRAINVNDSLAKRMKRESLEQHVMLSHEGLIGDGVFNNGELLQSVIDKYDPAKNAALNGNIAIVNLCFPQGHFYIGNSQIIVPNGVKISGYGRRNWSSSKAIPENELAKNGATIIYTDLDNTTDVAFKFCGRMPDGSIPKQYTETDIKIVGLGAFLVDNVGLSNLSIYSKNNTGIGVNALNTVLSEYSDISIFNFEYNFIGSGMWNTKINRLASFGHRCNGIYLEGYGGGMEISGISVSANSGFPRFENKLNLPALERGRLPLLPTGITIVGMTSLKIDQFTVENSPVGIRIVDSKNVQLDTLHTEVCTYGVFDIDNSSVKINNYFDYQHPDSGSWIFNLTNKALVNADLVELNAYYQYVFKVDDTSRIKVSNSNIQNGIISNKNITIFRGDDEIEQSIDLALNLADYTTNKANTNHKLTKSRGSYVKNGRTIVYDYEAEVEFWDVAANDSGRLRIGVGGDRNFGMLQVVLSGLKEGQPGDKILMGYADFTNSTATDVKCSEGFLTTNVVRRYTKIRISGSLITNF